MRKEKREVEVIKSICCDICKKDYSNDTMELQEMTCINYVGGYNSVFGDNNKIKCDICQHCLKEIFGDKINMELGES